MKNTKPSDNEIIKEAKIMYPDRNIERWAERLIAFKKGAKWMEKYISTNNT